MKRPCSQWHDESAVCGLCVYAPRCDCGAPVGDHDCDVRTVRVDGEDMHPVVDPLHPVVDPLIEALGPQPIEVP